MDSPRPLKRRRVSNPNLTTHPAAAPTANSPPPDPQNDPLLTHATHVLATEAAALAHITNLYLTSPPARTSLRAAVHCILTSQRAGGRLIACGVGKSAYIAQKLTATCKSLGIAAGFLHACEAVHGDLGDIRGERDVLLFVSFSGRTPELMGLLPHVPVGTRVIALTGHTEAGECGLLAGRTQEDGGEGSGRSSGILLPAPVLEREVLSFGVAAPTTSTTVALAVADMLALTVAGEMHGGRMGEVFKRNHPGGAIGVEGRETTRKQRQRKRKGGEEGVVPELPTPCVSASDDG
ncbi:hypothetical protein LTR91_000327 [Friedmanniomyces endolithicus]|uniref:SIS domain-containing protein n=1 Tax=Friedmanniomyces endolithicus TaxID=329885 RepID=A0A4U0VJI6_9PEZI|nr:hypothetical protein LTS09_009078 [Friedmanniomyces endolithicus]KAK0277213.1 hypothetical protein LTR35_010123 [Friedmanniomyces endolithicus]KAK0298342.1 hypothetical protein LTS00_003307 [Friedmanniomyces endolithicus]KAK0313766.1 hypothetical protein LTR01_002023 [Friedmanniomyces endolithicus]KAK0317403.1 hypothetical protein LTR82_011726 [Friedmanniomyces endolithicus]